MMSDEQRQIFFKNWHNQWIKPELDRRFGDAGLPDNFKIRQCLILLPKGREPIVQFNDEFGWLVEHPTLAEGKKLEEMDFGEPIYLHEVLSIDRVLPPMVDNERVSFMYFYWEGNQYILFVDFLPNQPDYDPNNERFQFDGKVIANHLKTIMLEKAVGGARVAREQLHQIGLWIAPSLLHYPMAKIVERIGEGQLDEARQILINHCDKDFISGLVQTWFPVDVFEKRKEFFDDAVCLHKKGRYHGSISILIGQIEGLLTDWLLDVKYYTDDNYRRLSTKIDDFRGCLNQIPNLLWLYREARDSMLDFLYREPWLQRFTNWNQPINTAFPSRNVVQHGKYAKEVFTEENSIKLFLLLDSICQFMMFYEVRILERDLGQNENKEQ